MAIGNNQEKASIFKLQIAMLLLYARGLMRARDAWRFSKSHQAPNRQVTVIAAIIFFILLPALCLAAPSSWITPSPTAYSNQNLSGYCNATAPNQNVSIFATWYNGSSAARETYWPAFSKKTTLTLSSLDGSMLAIAADDVTNTVLVGTYTIPARLYKLDAASFNIIGNLTLANSETNISSVIVDSQRGFVYFGTGDNPGKVIQVNISSWQRVANITFIAGEGTLRSAVIDPTNHYGYFSAYVSPGKVIKVNLTTLARMAVVTFSANENSPRTGVIDTTKNIAYFGTDLAPSRVIKINTTPSNFARVANLTLATHDNFSYSSAIDTARQVAYFGMSTQPARVVKINLTNFQRMGTLTLNSGENNGVATSLDPANQKLYVSTWTTPGIVVKVNLTGFTREGNLTLSSDDSNPRCSALNNGTLYLGSYATDGYVTRVNLTSFSKIDNYPVGSSLKALTGAVIDEKRGVGYFGTETSPGMLVQVNLSSMQQMNYLKLNNTQDRIHTGIIDEEAGYGYFANYWWPINVIFKVNLTTFIKEEEMPFDNTNAWFTNSAIDRDNKIGYFLEETWPGMIKKINLTSFQLMDTLTLDTGDNGPVAMVIDAKKKFLYIGTSSTAPGYVIKVNLSNFQKIGNVTLNAGETGLRSAVIDPDKDLGYFVSGTNPSKVIKVNLSSMQRVDNVTFLAGEDGVKTSAIDTRAGLAYFATNTDPGKIIRINLTNFQRATDISFAAGEAWLASGAIDVSNGYAYFGGYTTPGKIMKVNLYQRFNVSNPMSLGNITGPGIGEDWKLGCEVLGDAGYSSSVNSSVTSVVARVTNTAPTTYKLENDTSIDISEQGQSGIQIVLGSPNGTGNNYSALITLNLSQNIDISNLAMNLSRSLAKSFIHNSTGIVGIINKSLLIPRVWGYGRIYICPGATSLDQVYQGCAGQVLIGNGQSSGGMSVSQVTYDSENYYLVTNISGTGGGEASCGDLNQSVTLVQDVSINGSTCFNITAQNVMLDCAGNSIVGNNTHFTYGAYSNQLNTTVRNCYISGFETAIFYDHSNNSAIVNSTLYSTVNHYTAPTYSAAAYMKSSSHGRYQNLSINSTNGRGFILLSSNISNAMNVKVASQVREAFYMDSSVNATLKNVTGQGGNNNGIYVEDSPGSLFIDCNATGGTDNGFVIYSDNAQVYNTSADEFSIGGSNNLFMNISAISSDGWTLYIDSDTYNNTVIGANLYSGSGEGVYIYGSQNHSLYNITANTNTGYGYECLYADNIRINNLTATSNTQYGAKVGSCHNNTYTNLKVSGREASYGAFWLTDSVQTTIANSTINGLSGKYGLYLSGSTGSTNNMILNNTFLNASHQIYVAANSGVNVFAWNNFTNASVYVTDLNGTNRYNYTMASQNEGNIYENVLNDTVSITGSTTSSGYPALKIGTAGAGYPYNKSNSLGMFNCSFSTCADFAPLTSQSIQGPGSQTNGSITLVSGNMHFEVLGNSRLVILN